MEPPIVVTWTGEELVGDDYALDAALTIRAASTLDRVRRGEEEVFPASIANALLQGTNPVKALREYRGLTQRQLADIAGINTVSLFQIETGRGAGSLETIRSIAAVLKVDTDLVLGNLHPEESGNSPDVK
jgi:DNA-binding XRE family transcriptional regulator